MSNISKNQIDKFGRRIRTGETLEGDHQLLRELNVIWLSAAWEAAKTIQENVSVEYSDISVRAKNLGTIEAKLHRQVTLQLSYMRDLAGCRLVVAHGRKDQECAASEIMETFVACSPKYINRIADPRVGYRAIHLAVNLGITRVEIQIRTKLQHAWAEAMERLGDLAGRDVRYIEGFQFAHLLEPARFIAFRLRNSLLYLSEIIDEYELVVMRIADSFQRSEMDQSVLMLARVRMRLALKREIVALSESHKREFDRLMEVLR